MKAVRIHEYGGPEVLRYEDAPRPEHVSGELLVRIHAAGVNPVDWKVRAGCAKAPLLTTLHSGMGLFRHSGGFGTRCLPPEGW